MQVKEGELAFGVAHIYASFNDTFVHVTDLSGRETIVRVVVMDGDTEVAYETAVLGRLRRGYRVLQLRSQLGTRIELCRQRTCQARDERAAAGTVAARRRQARCITCQSA